MFCKYCGKEIDDEAAFCKYCGKSLKATPNPDHESKADPVQQAPKTRLNARILQTLKKEFHVDPNREIRNFTSFHGSGYWGPPVGIIVCAVLGFVIFLFWFAVIAFAVWEIILVVRIFRSAFGITDTHLLVKIWPSQTYEIPLDQIEEVSVKLTPFIRSGVCGDLQITTKDQTFYFKSVSNVTAFKNTLVQKVNEKEKPYV